MPLPAVYGSLGHAHMTSLTGPKEILGVDNAQYTTDLYRSGLHASPYACTAVPLGRLLVQAVRLARARVGADFHQFSVFLSISQYFSVFNRSATTSVSQV